MVVNREKEMDTTAYMNDSRYQLESKLRGSGWTILDINFGGKRKKQYGKDWKVITPEKRPCIIRTKTSARLPIAEYSIIEYLD